MTKMLTEPAAHHVDDAEIQSWFRNKEFAYDWTSPHFPVWTKLLAALIGEPVRILEVGSYEGRSAIFFLNFLPRSALVCIDAWDIALLEPALVKLIPDLLIKGALAEARFDRNLSVFADRLTKIKALSSDALAELGVKQERFDVVYVDGDHRRMGAYRDCLLSWPLVKPGGLLLIDDYEWDLGLAEPCKPKQGIDAFLNGIEGQFAQVHRAYQIAVCKR